MKKIIVIEDDQDLRMLLKVSLEKEGYHVLAACDGEAGLAMVMSELPDLVLLDIILPSISGWEICKKIKSNSKTSSVPVIFVSSKNRFQDKVFAMSLSASDYITKPFEMKEMMDKITKYISKQPSSRTQSILVVEDDEAIRRLLEAMFMKEGYKVYLASDGLQGFEMTSRLQPDIIIMDVMMPVMNGWDLCERLKKNPDTSGIPVVFLTVKRDPKDRQAGMAMGAADYITKPFNIEYVKKSIKNILEKGKENK